MKSLLVLLCVCSLLGTSLPVFAYESRGARPCAGWQEFRRDERDGYVLNAEVYQTWLVGYLSGLVAGSGVDFLVGTDNAAIFLMVDRYCNENPQTDLAAAGIYVARSLMQQKEAANQTTLP